MVVPAILDLFCWKLCQIGHHLVKQSVLSPSLALFLLPSLAVPEHCPTFAALWSPVQIQWVQIWVTLLLHFWHSPSPAWSVQVQSKLGAERGVFQFIGLLKWQYKPPSEADSRKRRTELFRHCLNVGEAWFPVECGSGPQVVTECFPSRLRPGCLASQGQAGREVE